MEVPSKGLLSLEFVRAVYEYGLGLLLDVPLQFICPKGDGHPVMVIPGLGAGDKSTQYIRRFFTNLGYDTHSWGLGRNLGPRNGLDHLMHQMVHRAENLYNATGEKQISLIGWSLGGIYAREIAKSRPEIIRQVITLGTPFKGLSHGTNVGMLYEILSKDKNHRDPGLIEKIATPPPVPFTSIYSKTDGVVHWKSSIEDLGDFYENIEVPAASHMGLGHNPISMYIIANRLTQTKERWQPYKSR